MLKNSFYLSTVIESVNTDYFGESLLDFLHSKFQFESTIAFNFPSNQKPSCLLQSERESINQFNIMYENGAYLHDPFYQSVNSTNEINIFKLNEIAPKNFDKTEYYQDFYHKTGWSNETGILVKIDRNVTIGFFFSNMSAMTSHLQSKDLIETFHVIKSLLTLRLNLIQHGTPVFNQIKFQLNSLSTGETEASETENASINSLYSKLTTKEKEIVNAILEGKTSKEIANQMYISTGTVKNHRKNIYAKLKINSQCELFHLFTKRSNKIIEHKN